LRRTPSLRRSSAFLFLRRFEGDDARSEVLFVGVGPLLKGDDLNDFVVVGDEVVVGVKCFDGE